MHRKWKPWKSSIWFRFMIYWQKQRKSRLRLAISMIVKVTKQPMIPLWRQAMRFSISHKPAKRKSTSWWTKSIKPRLSYRVLKWTKRVCGMNMIWAELCRRQSNIRMRMQIRKQPIRTNWPRQKEFWMIKLPHKCRSIKPLPAWQQAGRL